MEEVDVAFVLIEQAAIMDVPVLWRAVHDDRFLHRTRPRIWILELVTRRDHEVADPAACIPAPDSSVVHVDHGGEDGCGGESEKVGRDAHLEFASMMISFFASRSK